MIVFKDVLSGDELFSDAFKYEEKDGVFYEVEGKLTTEKTDVSDEMIGGNKSAEDDGQEDSEQQGTTGINVVLANKLWEQEGFKKKDYKKHIKEYIKRIVAHLQEKKPDEVDKFKADASKAVVSILSKYDDLQLFRGESLDPDVDEGECMLVLVEYRDSKPFLLFFKHGLEEEKM